MNLFGSSPTSNSPYVAPNPLHDPIAGPDPLSASPSSSYESPRRSFSKRSVEIPQPRAEEESPEVYLHRLTDAVSKAEVATVLASSADPFHARALRAYIDRFDFMGDPLDVALRKLLMDVGLPRETQQIDRVIEAFAARYLRCNPDLFTSEDHPYILAFSLIMLHTDAFNKHNKRKMTKADYVKNTRLPGVAPEVLDCFYDNIIFVPFIFIEDPVDVNGQRGLIPETINMRRMSTFNMPTTPGGSGSVLLGKSNRIDPYYLITRNLLDDLRVNVTALVPPESPYSYQGTGGPWDEDELLRAFTMASAIDISTGAASTPWFGISMSGTPAPLLQSPLGPTHPVTSPASSCSIKVTKVGLLLRKDDTLEGGRRANNRKWRAWCLLFFRDPSWVASIQTQCNGQILAHAALPHPDEYVSVKDSVAVFDKSYTKHPHTMRLVMPDGHHYLLQAQEEKEMNEWISRVNYASAFKTAGVRMRASGMTNRDIELTGIAAAASHLRELKHRANSFAAPRVRTWYAGSPDDLEPSVAQSAPPPLHPLLNSDPVGQISAASSVDSSRMTPSQIESSSRLFKATFDQVKTELATSGRWSYDVPDARPIPRPRTQSLESATRSPPASPTSATPNSNDASRGSSRSEIIRRKLRDLEGRISLTQKQLDTDMRFVRNMAVLTPFQRTTRDRIQVAVQGASKRIMQVRLDLEKLVCYRDVLSDDLLAEERDWARTKRIAMRAATDKLTAQDMESRPLTQTRTMPDMITLSSFTDVSDQSLSTSPMSIAATASTSVSSSLGDESFHSALSSGHWRDLSPGSAAFLESRGLHEAHSFESPMTSPLEAPGGHQGREYPFPDVSGRPQPTSLVQDTSMESAPSSVGHADHAGQEKYRTAPESPEVPEEQAEEWHKTRAAKRVSLVRLPPDLRISVLIGKHGRTASESISEHTATAPSSPDGSHVAPNAYGRTMDTIAVMDVDV
ncbi:uncharacterized protein LAESUDRAFT_736750 [Laetiporus sulphureus 93-53]|uniref:Uncharacterized protein n=1 Tax=Laetiporus sulphureus 93-53 TaxID=1314785 RepID=A0A165EEF1_9APHY|nr:uncharacterized protein LAESUDRAFT_736750 [Laetiporus sulphureus 93-53]KZT06873.1 hypothetical protein LAESUDRAFT_736750 [Laetiporus sulphureus 93-53]